MIDYVKVGMASAELFEAFTNIDEQVSDFGKQGLRGMWDATLANDAVAKKRFYDGLQKSPQAERRAKEEACIQIGTKYNLSRAEIDLVQNQVIKLLNS